MIDEIKEAMVRDLDRCKLRLQRQDEVVKKARVLLKHLRRPRETVFEIFGVPKWAVHNLNTAISVLDSDHGGQKPT